MFFPQGPIHYNFPQPPYSYFGLSYLNCLNDRLASLLKVSQYERQYQKNFNDLKAKYKNQIYAGLSFNELYVNLAALSSEKIQKESNEAFKKKIYCFLCFLSVFEVDFNKSHEFFVFKFFLVFSQGIFYIFFLIKNPQDWDNLALNSRFLSGNDCFTLKEEIFKKIKGNTIWRQQDDELLSSIIRFFCFTNFFHIFFPFQNIPEQENPKNTLEVSDISFHSKLETTSCGRSMQRKVD